MSLRLKCHTLLAGWSPRLRPYPAAFGLPIIQMALLTAVASRIQSIRGSHPAIPMSRVLDRALLVSEICVDQTIALRVAFCPLEVVE